MRAVFLESLYIARMREGPAAMHNFTSVLASREWLWGKNDDGARCKALMMLTDFLLNSWQARERENSNWRRRFKRWTVRNHRPSKRLYGTWKFSFLADFRAVINVKLLSKEEIAILDSKEGQRVTSFITVTLMLSILKYSLLAVFTRTRDGLWIIHLQGLSKLTDKQMD